MWLLHTQITQILRIATCFILTRIARIARIFFLQILPIFVICRFSGVVEKNYNTSCPIFFEHELHESDELSVESVLSVWE